MKTKSACLTFATACLLGIAGCGDAEAQAWFTTGQDADLMLSGVDFNNAGGPLLYNHPSGIASDGTRFLLCDRFNNRVLVWNTLPARWDAPPDLVLGQRDFVANNPGASRGELNWPGNVSVGSNGVVAVADTENDRILIWRTFPAWNAQAADVSISLPSLTPPGGRNRYEWPWGVWTDGQRLVASATHGSALLFWKTLPSVDDQPPDEALRLPQFGTLRNISTDGATCFFVGDHNAQIDGNRSGTYFWNAFPTRPDQPYDFFLSEWMKGVRLPDGKLVAGGLASIYLWNRVPTSQTQQPDLVLTTGTYKNGDGPDVVFAGGRLYFNNYNGNNVHVYNGVPTRPAQQPDFALGSPSVNVNTLDSIHYIQNPVVATDGTGLVVTSDFDRSLWVWKSLPLRSGAAPDLKMSLQAFDLAPWDNALHGGRLVTAGRQKVAVWDTLPLDGQGPSRIFTSRIGTAQFQELKGVALDSQYFYLADQSGSIYVWNGLPVTGSENPFRVITAPGQPLNHLHSDGVYLCVAVQSAQPAVYVYRVADIAAGGAIQPFKTIASTPQLRLNLPAGAITFDGSLAVANTGNHAVYLWKDLRDAGDPDRVVVLGQPSPGSTDAAIGRNRLFMPASLTVHQNRLWVGEVKFSSRILQFSARLAPGGGVKSANFDGDGDVDFDDFFAFAAVFGQRGGQVEKFDLDSDGEVDFGDFFMFVDAFAKRRLE